MFLFSFPLYLITFSSICFFFNFVLEKYTKICFNYICSGKWNPLSFLISLDSSKHFSFVYYYVKTSNYIELSSSKDSKNFDVSNTDWKIADYYSMAFYWSWSSIHSKLIDQNLKKLVSLLRLIIVASLCLDFMISSA